MEQLIEGLLDDAGRAGLAWVALAAFLFAFAETALFTDLLVPGEVGMILVGAVSARAELDVWWVILAAAVGATLGDSVGWWLGARFGLRILSRFPKLERRLSPAVERAHRYFEVRGGAVVFWGRFVGALRGVVSLVAGTAGMPYKRFLAWNALASICWTTTVILAGYAFGRNVDAVLSEIGLAVAGTIVVVGITVFLLRRRWRRASRFGHAEAPLGKRREALDVECDAQLPVDPPDLATGAEHPHTIHDEVG